MAIFRKVGTLLRVWSDYGAKTVWGLARDNLRGYIRRAVWTLRRVTHLPAVRRWRNARVSPDRMRILYVTTRQEARWGQTFRYRVANLMQALRGRMDTRLETLEEDIDEDTLRWADLAVLMRVPRSKAGDRFFETAARARLPVVFDIDDLIFLPEFFEPFCRTRPNLTPKEKQIEKKTFDGFYEYFCRCAFATTSTPFIAERMRAHGKEAFVIRNGLNARQLRIAARRKGAVSSVRTILYLSGSQTHSRDFSAALPALERILRAFPDVRLCVVGYLDLDDLPDSMLARTDTLPFMEWGRMLAFTAGCTVNIAPLDTENPFCHAKSELKYFEAALVGVPTVASPTDTFRRCIRPGENGLLASTEEEWYQSLRLLLTDGALYARMRDAAQQDAREHYAPSAVAEEAETVYRQIARQVRSRAGHGV